MSASGRASRGPQRPARTTAASAVALVTGYLVATLGDRRLSRARAARQRAERDLSSARLRLEQQAVDLADARELAGQAARLKSAFVANISHEIRTPMNGVLGLTQLLAAEPDLPAAQREQAQLAHRSALALQAVLDDVVDFSRLEAGQLDVEATEVDLRELVDDTIRLFAGTAEDKGLRLTAQVEPAVPAVVLTDPTGLRQVLLNLVGNAVKFTHRGEVRVEVTQEGTVGRGHAVRFAVVDTGVGIDLATQPLLFEPFRQGEDSTTRRYGGAGLGLTISASLVALLGGSLDLSSRPEQGATFYFTLLLTTPVDGPAAAGPQPHAEPATCDGTATRDETADGPLLLVAEDNPVNQQVARGQLASLGYRVEVVPDGLAAAEAARSGRYAAVLMDCHMPTMDGYQATMLIREDERAAGARRVPIIAVTASAMRSDRERCLAVGMDDHLAKPVRLPLLAETLDRWLAEPYAHLEAGIVASTASCELLDGDIIADLRTLPAADLGAVLDSWVDATAERLAELRHCAELPEVTEVEVLTRLAHSTKGSSASVGARRLAAVAADLEQHGRRCLENGLPLDDAGLPELLDRLDDEFRLVGPLLRVALFEDAVGAPTA